MDLVFFIFSSTSINITLSFTITINERGGGNTRLPSSKYFRHNSVTKSTNLIKTRKISTFSKLLENSQPSSLESPEDLSMSAIFKLIRHSWMSQFLTAHHLLLSGRLRQLLTGLPPPLSSMEAKPSVQVFRSLDRRLQP